jgi:hypothetical protein
MTAVEWLLDKIELKAKSIPTNTQLNRSVKGAYVDCLIMLRQAKEIEKQQIIDAYKDSTCQFSVDSRIDYPKSAEQYYNETFKNK